MQLHSFQLREAPPRGSAWNAVGRTVVELWKPDASWEDDEMLRVHAQHGPVEPDTSVYEQFEVSECCKGWVGMLGGCTPKHGPVALASLTPPCMSSSSLPGDGARVGC